MINKPVVRQDSLLKSSTLFSAATLISRVLGLVRDACIAAMVPGALQDIFWAGIKIPSTFRQLFAEGALSAAFIPTLTRVREHHGEEKAREVGFAVLWLLFPVVTIVVVLAMYTAPYYVPYVLAFDDADTVIIAGDDGATMTRIEAGVYSTQVMFPFLVFIALAAWTMGVLNTYRHFFVPALASAFFNICLIAGALIVPGMYTGADLVFMLGMSVILGGFMQFAVQLGSMKQVGYFPIRWVSPTHPMVYEFLAKLGPSVFGLAIYQLNALITQTYFASTYDEGGISIINYAHRLIQFPLGVVGIALTTASFPRIAQHFEQKNLASVATTLNDVLKYLLLLMIPAGVGFVVLGEDIVGLIYDRGEFRNQGWLDPTYTVLAVYCSGLYFYAAFGVFARTFQAHHDFRTPVICGGVAVAVNIGACALFVSWGWDIWSLALAAALSSLVNTTLLAVILSMRHAEIRYGSVFLFAGKVILASLGMGVACWGVLLVLPGADGAFEWYLLRVIVGMSLSLLAYSALGWLLFRREILRIIRRG